MTLRSRLMIGLIATASFPLISFGTDATSTTTAPRVYSETEITYIRGINCDTFTGDAKSRCLEIKKAALSQALSSTGNIVPLPVKSGTTNTEHQSTTPANDYNYTRSNKERGILDQSGSTHSGTTLPKPPKPPMGTGAEMGNTMEGLGMAIGKLTPTDREVLVKMIREYLTSKGVTLGAPEVKTHEAERKGWDGSIKGKKTATEIQAERAALLAKAKAKREEMKKEYVGHVTLMK